uniref:site-specific DNA-methyltransferase (adenine-specific) n=1 Tax=Paracoccus marcusii TaxID=59779 RepID=J7K707_9RHOB|nr:DNA methyltransferase [Paracoccus marcusii]AFQ90331.1 hypothetical protein [Paracoccus marcusii]
MDGFANQGEGIDPIDEWLAYVQEGSDGLVLGGNVLKELGLTPTRQTAADDAAMAEALNLVGDNPAASELLTPPNPWLLFGNVLGWPVSRVAGAQGGPELPPGLTVAVPEQDDHLAPTWAVLNEDGEAQVLITIESSRSADQRNDGDGWAASPHHRLDRLIRETGVGIGILLAPGIIRLIYAPDGETSGWITWPLAAMTGPGGRPMLAGLKLALGRGRFFVGPKEHRLRQLLEASRKAQNDVSERLSGQVLGALHDLLRGLHDADPDRTRRLAEEAPRHLYEGLLTCLMRLVFVLYAEDRDLLPTSREPEAQQLWQSGYSVRTLFARLDDDAARYFDTMEDRRGGWGQLLAVFRLIHGGQDRWIKGRGGKLFDPDIFPFLEGREADEAAQVLPVSDACVHRVLQGLMTLRGPNRTDARERLSYRTLDVEQIGSVYETVMGFRAYAATEPMIAVVDEKGLPTFLGLDSLLKCKPVDRTKWLKDHAVTPTAGQIAALRNAGTVQDAVVAFAIGNSRGHRAGLIDLRGSPDSHILPAGAPYLQPTDERRRSGSHYTPRELTGPIVTHALEPAFTRIGEEATPDEVLRLKVCDPACGSGAFLVEACRQIGKRLQLAWEKHKVARPTFPADETEEIHARRLVAQRCLYGVDKNPMAVDLAKLSLWLATLASDHEFTFLDHAVKTGDSLVGLTEDQIERMSWLEGHRGLGMFGRFVSQRIEEARAVRRDIRTAGDDVTLALQEVRLRDAEKPLVHVRHVADAVVSTFFAADKARARKVALDAFYNDFENRSEEGGFALAARMSRDLRAGDVTPFHWSLEFPEVFEGTVPGFDAIVGNPPFAGKNTISAMGGPLYIPWLQLLHTEAHGNADLVAHFFRRAYGMLREGGTFGLIATNTIGQGDTRASALRPILRSQVPPEPGAGGERAYAVLLADPTRGGGTILRATKRLKWPGEAAVVVSVVHVRKALVSGRWSECAVLDGREVDRISAYLVEGGFDDSPAVLADNAEKAFQGSVLLGMGFTFDDAAAAKGEAESVAEMERLIAKDSCNAERIKPFLGGEEVNTSPTHAHDRYAIDFENLPLRRDPSLKSWNLNPGTEACEKRRRDWLRTGVVPADYPDPVAADWPDLLEIVERRVKPERATNNDQQRREVWWRYTRPAPGLKAATASLPQILMINCGATPHMSFTGGLPSNVFSHSLVVLAYSNLAPFAVLQSRVHEVWARGFSSTLEDRLRYTASDCFETFPFPADYEEHHSLEDIGRRYLDHRAGLMEMTDKGMTKTYNDFHDATLRASNGMIEMRDLHVEMDRAVLRSYGWHDLAATLAPVFLAKPPGDNGRGARPGQLEDDHTYQGRLFWPQAARDAVLARLLALNATRAAGLPDPTYGDTADTAEDAAE